ncbi:hypothetical protein FACS1894166_13260 [Bacilli bacterium]|nr:hypothetical protein FACS1894166_13260 [Bacilli bacterium]
MKHKTHTLSQNEKNKHHKKKVLLLAILIPLGFLASGGAVVGGMAIAKVGPFKPRAQTPITLSNALYGDDTHTDVVLGVTYSQTEANALTEQTLMGALYTWLTTPGNHGDTGYN